MYFIKSLFLLWVVAPIYSFSQVFTTEYLLGRFEPASHPDFIRIENTYTEKENIYLRREAYTAFQQMAAAAKRDGFTLRILSATRNFTAQKSIWERKWQLKKYTALTVNDRAKEILRYSSMPGTSRHHWGTDIDLNALDPEWFRSGEGKKLYAWLVKNAPSFGFYQPYTSKTNGRTGYEEEAWHWSYLPISEKILSAYLAQIQASDINGFLGNESADDIHVIEDYVNGIDRSLKKADK